MRKLDNTARVAQKSVPGIVGTIILEDEDEEKKRRIRARNGSAVTILKELAQSQIIERNGDSTYHLHVHPVLRDQGNHLAILDEHSEEAIVAGLLLGREKFGSTLTVTGSPEFQQRLVAVAVAQGIAIRFADPDLETMRTQLIADKRQAAQTIRKPVPKPQQQENILSM